MFNFQIMLTKQTPLSMRISPPARPISMRELLGFARGGKAADRKGKHLAPALEEASPFLRFGQPPKLPG